MLFYLQSDGKPVIDVALMEDEMKSLLLDEQKDDAGDGNRDDGELHRNVDVAFGHITDHSSGGADYDDDNSRRRSKRDLSCKSIKDSLERERELTCRVIK